MVENPAPQYTRDRHSVEPDESDVSSFSMELDLALSEAGIALRDWTAQDFASIYVRFRPHLISHARKTLRDESQVEEVVQEAFLYLMVSLPELDSEAGVLRFLKWKVRLLALDVIRANSRASLVPLDDEQDPPASDLDPSQIIERADDAAVVSLALAKLQPRQREAIIASVFEERSSREAALQMGLTENAFRQLLFRARSAFKTALVGEAATSGMSVGEILSLAAKKAAKDSANWVSGASIFAVLALGLNVIFSTENLEIDSSTNISAPQANSPSEASFPPADEPLQGSDLAPDEEVRPADLEVDSSLAVEIEGTSDQSLPSQASLSVIDETGTSTEPALGESDSQLAALLGVQVAQQVANDLKASEVRITRNTLTVESPNGLQAFVGFDPQTESVIQHVYVNFEVEGHRLTGVPLRSHWVSESVDNSGLTKVSYAATDFLVGDFEGAFENQAVESSPFSRSGLLVEILIGATGEVENAQITLLPRT